MERPETRYARSGDLSIAYQVIGAGPVDVVFVPPYVSNVELVWDIPPRAEGMRRIAEFARLITFDKRGTGLSDRITGAPSLEERMDDVRAVMDAVESSRAVLLGVLDGGPLSIVFAATYPERCTGLALFDTYARATWAPDHAWRPTAQHAERLVREVEEGWGSREQSERYVAALWPDAQGAERDERIETIARFHRQSASPGGAAALERLNAMIDIRDVLASIQVPTLVLATRHVTAQMPMLERGWADAAFLAERIPTAQLLELADEGGMAFFGGDLAYRIGVLRGFVDEAARREPPEPDRVLATVLFTDIVDSTAHAVELGDRDWRDLVSRHHAAVRAQLARFRGRELDTAGDGFFAAFDGPARAIRCACAIGEAVDELGIAIRAGLHTGECEEIDGKVAGIAVATGARIAALAEPNEVLVSATVRDLVAGSGIDFEDRGVFTLKGLPEQRHVYAVAQH